MNSIIYTFSVFFIMQSVMAQSVGIGTTSPDASAQLDVSNTSKGILIPRLTTAQRSAITSPATGLLVFQTDGTPGFCYYNGTAWVNLTNGYKVNGNGIAAAVSYGLTTTLAGRGDRGANDGTGIAATFDMANGVATDASGNVYVADRYNHKIRKISPDGVVTTLAGSGSRGDNNGAGTAASFNQPFGVATDAAGNVYVADNGNHKIRKIIPLPNGTGTVSTLAGSGTRGADDGIGASASFAAPEGVATDAMGNVYVADYGNNKIRKITAAGVVTTLAGSGAVGANDGIGASASFTGPAGVATDAMGNVYVADWWNNKIRKIFPLPNGSGVVTTLAGNGTTGSVDGIGSMASFIRPSSMAIDGSGYIYVGGGNIEYIRIISPDGMVSTLAPFIGTSQGLAVDGSGNLYVACGFYNLIRKIIVRRNEE